MPDRLSFAVGPATSPVPTTVVTSFTNPNVKTTFDNGPSCTMALPGRSVAAQNISGLATDLWVFKLGDLWQRLRIQPVAQEWDEDGDDQVSISAVGYKQVVKARHIRSGPPVFNAVDQGTIIWNLIQHTQGQTGGDLGITAGTILTGQLRDRNEYKIGDKIGTLTDNLESVINGPWWDIDADLQLQVRLADDFDTLGIPLLHGDNVRKIRRTPSGSFANAGGAKGSDLDGQTTPTWITDPSAATDPRGLWERFDASHSTVTDQALVDEYAAGAVNLDPPATWTITLEPARYFGGDTDVSVGMFCRIVKPASIVDGLTSAPVDVVVQLTEVTAGTDEDGGTLVTATGVEVPE